MHDKVVLVTGANRGLGLAITRQYLMAGATVHAGSRHRGDMPAGAFHQPMDVTCDEAVRAAVANVVSDCGRLDILVNNAGVMDCIAPVGGGIDSSAAKRLFDVNVTGTLRCMEAALPHLVASRGVVVNIASGAATVPFEGWAVYCASKAAVLMLSKVAMLENAERGIRIFSVNVPATDTDMQTGIRASRINRISRIPRQQLASAEAVASFVVAISGEPGRRIDEVMVDPRDASLRALLESHHALAADDRGA